MVGLLPELGDEPIDVVTGNGPQPLEPVLDQLWVAAVHQQQGPRELVRHRRRVGLRGPDTLEAAEPFADAVG
ncbi:hypothetical protein Asi02nite_12590 [Asanoa siamensis]|uniref:Uncharacterized protein n=1 Tax=Asanoa siamensis TaxID=926357 RepID=A0ABQ4CKE4_9ACTN|nr:hypothetical protein Asi02nite_12590 [Asanoa siamensis]